MRRHQPFPLFFAYKLEDEVGGAPFLYCSLSLRVMAAWFSTLLYELRDMVSAIFETAFHVYHLLDIRLEALERNVLSGFKDMTSVQSSRAALML